MADQIKLETIGLGQALFTISQLENDIQSTRSGVSSVINDLDWEVRSKEQIDNILNEVCKDLSAQRESLEGMKTAFQTAITRSDDFNSEFVREAAGIITAIIAVLSTTFPASTNSVVQTLSGIKDWLNGLDNKLSVGESIGNTNNDSDHRTDSVVNKGNIELIVAYRDNNFKSDIWPSGYNGASGCGVASLAMAFSSLGLNITPKDIMDKNARNNPEYVTSAAYNPTSYSGMEDVKNVSNEIGNDLNLALERYKDNPGVYSAPMVWLSFKGMSHAVVVIDSNPDGTYKILDPSGNYIDTLRVCNDIPSWNDDKKNKIFETSFSSIKQYKKEA